MASNFTAFIESMDPDEALMFATYVAGMSPQVFAAAAALIQRDRAAFGGPADAPDAPEPVPAALPEPPAVPELVPAPRPVPEEAARAIATIRRFAGPVVPPAPAPVEMPAQLPAVVPDVPEGVPSEEPQPVAVPDLPEPREVYERAVAEFVAPDGRFRRRPSIRALKRVLRCGQDRASEVREYLTSHREHLTEYVAS